MLLNDDVQEPPSPAGWITSDIAKSMGSMERRRPRRHAGRRAALPERNLYCSLFPED